MVVACNLFTIREYEVRGNLCFPRTFRELSANLTDSLFSAWNTLGYLRPDLKELEDVKEVWLSLPLASSSKKEQVKRNKEQETRNDDSTVNSAVITVEKKDEEQVNKYKEQVKEQVNLSDKQKEILIYLLDNPSVSLKSCSEATGASAMSIRYTFKKVKSWLEIRHIGPDKTGTWSFELVNK